MAAIRLSSWNVNGFRAISKKPEWDWFYANTSDIVSLQETKASPDQLDPTDVAPPDRQSWWAASTVKKGYSGVAVFSKIKPLRANLDMPDPDYQHEGRCIHLEFQDFHFFNIYFPNGGAEISKGVFKRLKYKIGFFDAWLDYAETLRRDKPIVVCGDFNIAHRPIDLARPKDNEKYTGFLPEERAWLDRFIALGYIDTFRRIHGDVEGAYTWWSYKTSARERNIGWRIDYFFVSSELEYRIANAWIEDNVYGSDHCPVGLLLDI